MSSDTLGTYALEEKKPCAPRGQRRSETGLCPGKELDHLLSEATLEGGSVARETVYAWNQSPRLWLLVFRDKLI